jgi:hypothetical protein
MLAHDYTNSLWRFGDVFDEVCTLGKGGVPKNFELLLVPGLFFAALVHAPLNGSKGYPMPLGIISSAPDLIKGVHELMLDIVSSERPSTTKSRKNVEMTEQLLEILQP